MKSAHAGAPGGAAAPHASEGAPKPLLSRLDAVAIIVGIVVGAGIYKTPSMVAGVTGDYGWALVAWVAGGVVSLIGALCYAELATTFPHAGGDYHFLTRAYGRHVSFLFAWARATVINTGSIALLAFVFGDYVSRLFPLGAGSGAIWAAIIVVVLTVVNIVGLRSSAITQNVLTTIEVGGLIAVIVAGIVAASIAAAPAAATAAAAGTATAGAGAASAGAVAAATPPAFSSTPPLGMLGLAMVFVLLTYGGWNEAAYISAEVKGGERAIVQALVTSIVILTVLYVAVNVALLAGLGLKGVADSKALGVDVMSKAFGRAGETAIAIAVAVATLTSVNATMLVGARTNYAIGRDWPALRFMGGWHVERGTPVAAFVVQGLIALALIAFGAVQKDGFSAMVEFTAPVFWFFFLLVGVSLFVLRAKEPQRRRPFRVPLYPVTPLVFVAVCAYLLYSSITYAASQHAVHVSLLVMAAGLFALVVTAMLRGDAPGRGRRSR